MSRIDSLIAAMTLAEKLGQLTMTASSFTVTGPVIAGDSTESIRSGALGNLLNMVGPEPVRQMQRLAVEDSRLKIPLLIGLDIIHGHRSLFPVPLAEAGLFDPATWEATAREAAIEGAADGLAMTFAPMCDVSRDPRWGRTVEGPGEDSYVASRMAAAKVRGFQGTDLAAPDALAAVAKHFVAYGPVTAGREYASVDVSERTLHEVHLPAFAAAVAAGAAAVMPAFTDLAGVPLTAHVPLLRDWLRGRLGFDGVIISDYNAIRELINHGVAADLVQAAALALDAGVDIDMMGDAYRQGLPEALQRGLVSMDQVDAAVRRVLLLKERLGLFDHPYGRCGTVEAPEALARRRQLARSAGARATLLLRNEHEVLPLAAPRRLALLGPLADAPGEMRGPWWAAGVAENHVSVLAGFRAALPGAQVLHAAGVGIEDAATEDAATEGTAAAGIAAAVALVEQADAVVLCLGEGAAMSGEAASRAHPVLPGRQLQLAQEVLARARGLERPAAVVLFCGRPLVIPELVELADALLVAWFPGCEAGNAVADVVLGRVGPAGRTPISWPRAVGQIPIFHGQRNSGRPENPRDHFTSKYLDVPNTPLFPFGHGLTYGRLRLSNLRLHGTVLRPGDTLEVSVDAVNEGGRAAEETVFLFTHDPVAGVARPLLELKGFAKISLAAGQRGTVRLPLRAADLAYLGPDLRPVLESGTVEVLVGPCADRSQLLAGSVEVAA
ncbi:MAG TPA: glycoside hydrolase family 3 N-terminal domain-containing protein [Steroidobacteraceae bacterium]|nr:glycoside hydrolase family 3 N-terminal domain-containing protein [Steroidobacteraceae bacterium]